MPVDEEEWEEEGETPPDLVNLGDTPGPGLLSNAPVHSTEPHPPTEASPEEGASESEEPLPEFDPRYQQDFEGLLYIGKLTKTFNWLGHRFTIRTLTTEEVLEVGLVHRQYAETVADVKAYQTAVVAACVVAVDDQPMPIPITMEPTDTGLINRFRAVLRWFPPTLDAVYNEYLNLESRVTEVIEAMGKVSG